MNRKAPPPQQQGVSCRDEVTNRKEHGAAFYLHVGGGFGPSISQSRRVGGGSDLDGATPAFWYRLIFLSTR